MTYALSTLLAVAALSSSVLAQAPPPAPTPAPAPPPGPAPPPTKSQFPQTPLASRRFAYPTGIPYKVDTEDLLRGIQFGYNQCNSTTEGPNSLCQTSFVNSIEDFCLWAPPKPDSLIADTEGEEVAWCTKPGRGTRLIPNGALQGVQFMKTPDYMQVVGFIDQSLINIKPDDYGGELDPHGADLRGNPLGGLMYSNGFPSNNGNVNNFQQVIEWHNFMGGNAFCIKVCDPAGPNAAKFCEHIYDRIGCAYNAPNSAQKGVFESCQGENQDFPGVYTENGAVKTYQQPPESLGPITTVPYTARIPASSNCVPYQSSSIYGALPTASGRPASAASSKSGAATAVAGSKTAGAPTPSDTNNAASLAGSSVLALMGVVFGVVFFA